MFEVMTIKGPRISMDVGMIIAMRPIMTPRLRRRREDRPEDPDAQRAPWKERRSARR
jgi:hypothetical protein